LWKIKGKIREKIKEQEQADRFCFGLPSLGDAAA